MDCPYCKKSFKIVCQKIPNNDNELKGRNLLKYLREKLGIKTKVLAKKLSLAASNISQMERGYIGIGETRARKFSEFFDFHPWQQFLDIRDEKYKKIRNAHLAQLAEHSTCNRAVESSTLSVSKFKEKI